MRSLLTRLGLVLLGVFVALTGAFVHRHMVEVLGVDWPWGLVLALGSTVVVAMAASHVGRVGETWFALGWMLVLFAQPLAPNGSYLVAGDWLGWVYTLAGGALLGAVIVHSAGRHRPRVET